MPDQNDQRQAFSIQIYEQLKAGILELRYPPGSFISDRTIAQEAGMSRTPVREALKRLSQEGWLVWQERKKGMVKSLCVEDVKEIFFLRKMIEPAALHRIFEKHESRHLAGQLSMVLNEMHESIEKPIDFIKADMDFHSRLVSFVKNRRLDEMWKKIADESTRIAIYALYEKRSSKDVIFEHEDLVEALWKRDLALSLARLENHHQSIYQAYEGKFRSGYEKTDL